MRESAAARFDSVLRERVLHTNTQRLPSIAGLAAEYGVGQRTVRAAVRRLAEEGVLDCRPGRGILVRDAQRFGPGSRYRTSGASAADRLRALIASAELRSGDTLPQYAYLARKWRIGRSSIREAFRVLEQEGLIHRQGRRWIAGRRPVVESPSWRPASDPLVVLIVVDQLRDWENLARDDRAGPFVSRFSEESFHLGMLPRLVLTSQQESLGVLASGASDVLDAARRMADRYAGAVIALRGDSSAEMEAWSRHLAEQGRPVVVLDKNDALRPGIRSRAGAVVSRCLPDEQAAVGRVAEALVALGHRHVAFVALHQSQRSWAQPRADRLAAALGRLDSAGRLYYTLLCAGVKVPEEMSLVSFDSSAFVSSVPVSTVDFGFGYLGYVAAHLIARDVPVRVGVRGDIASAPVLLDRGSLARARSQRLRPLLPPGY